MAKEYITADLDLVARTLRPIMYEIAGSGSGRSVKKDPNGKVEWEGWSLDRYRKPQLIISGAETVDPVEVDLLPRDFDYMKILIEAQNTVVPHETLRRDETHRLYQLHIFKLRARLGIYRDRLETVRRYGYVLRPANKKL